MHIWHLPLGICLEIPRPNIFFQAINRLSKHKNTPNLKTQMGRSIVRYMAILGLEDRFLLIRKVPFLPAEGCF